jgi:cytochrome b6-f complex iron-sulfur subunit
MNRKEFIQRCSYACLGAFAASAFLEGCTSTTHIASAVTNGNTISINKSEFVTSKKDVLRKFVIINSAKFEYPICIYKLNDTEFSALLMKCTHNSCELHPQGSYLVCPCHGSEFNNKGTVQNPPAERNLQTFTTTTDNENIYIHL